MRYGVDLLHDEAIDFFPLGTCLRLKHYHQLELNANAILMQTRGEAKARPRTGALFCASSLALFNTGNEDLVRLRCYEPLSTAFA